MLICGILKNDTNQLINNIDKLTDIGNKLIAIKVERGDQGDKLGVCDYHIQTTIYKINNKGNLGVWIKIYILYI